jgi:hypothetical protein
MVSANGDERRIVPRLANKVTEIIVRGVCLGRSPGYRRKDVDLAVRKSLVHEH